MSTAKAHFFSSRDLTMVGFVAVIFILAIVYSVFSSTTIGNNVNTGGTLTVSGASALASATFSDTVYASSTLQATGAALFYGTAVIGTATSSSGVALAVPNGATLLGGPVQITGPLTLPYLQATSSTASYFIASLGVGTTTPGALFSVHGPALISGTTTALGGLLTPSVNATGTLGIYTGGGAAPRVLVDSSGNIGVGSTTPTTTFSTVGSGYFTGGLGVGFATTGSGQIHNTGLTIHEGRLGVNGTTSPYFEFGETGSAAHSSAATTTLSVESTGSNVGGCIEIKGGRANTSNTRWLRIYVGGFGATNSPASGVPPSTVIGAGGAGFLVIEEGRCQ